MLSERTLSKIRSLGLDANGYLTVCTIVQEAIDDSRPATKQTTALALTLPADWPADYQEVFWKKYPAKKSKKEAMKAIDKVAFAGKTKWLDLIIGLDAYIISREVQRGFVKHPATWLNKECWKDESGPGEGTSGGPRGTKDGGPGFFEIAA